MDKVLGAQPRVAEVWLELAQTERAAGAADRAAAVLRRAVVAKCDDPYRLFAACLQLEREVGTLASYDAAAVRIHTQVALLEQQQWKELAKAREAAAEQAARATGPKRKREAGAAEPAAKRATPQPPEPAAPAAGTTTAGRNPYNDVSLQERTVFVSNLHFRITAEVLRAFLATSGPVEHVTIVTDGKGVSKGYGHAEFATKDGAAHALARDRERLQGRPVFLSPFLTARTTDRPARYPAGPSDTTVYVSNLPFTWTERHLQDLFQPVPVRRTVATWAVVVLT
jgi:squamous cell carcinoma antigen recognized by T-cells 3